MGEGSETAKIIYNNPHVIIIGEGMKKIYMAWLCAILMFSSVFVGLQVNDNAEARIAVGDGILYTPHAPIRIDSDADFPGIASAGDGSEATPWVIENWDINGTGYGYCIYIGNTTDYFEVRDCYLHDASDVYSLPYFYDSGMMIHNALNARVENITADYNGEYGIYLRYVNNSFITQNNAHYNTHGIGIIDSMNGTIINNVVSNGNYGLRSIRSNVTISFNSVYDNNFYGIELYGSEHNLVLNNTIINSREGICLWFDSQFNTITGNMMENNSNSGILIINTQNNTFTDNIMFNNSFNIDTNTGINRWNTHNISTTNLVNGHPVYYYKNQVGGTIPPGAGQVILANCSNMEVSGQDFNNGSVGSLIGHSSYCSLINNNFHNNVKGVLLRSSNNCTVSDNSFGDNNKGIECYYSKFNDLDNNIIYSGTGITLDTHSNFNDISFNIIKDGSTGIYISGTNNNNIIQGNTIQNHGAYGIWMLGMFLVGYPTDNIILENDILDNECGIYIIDYLSENNLIYHNNFINNNNQSFDPSNFWDNGYPDGGNYWSDYTGVDLNSTATQDVPPADGIGDIPYIIDGDSQDNYPLMEPWGTPPPSFTYDIALTPSWNLISIPLELADTTISTVLSSIAGQYDAVKYYDATDTNDPWKTYRPGASTNDLFNIDHKMGFWINMNDFTNLTIEGTEPASTDIPLYAGWNLVGYPALSYESVGNALWGTGADRVEVYDIAEPYLIKEVGPTYTMQHGEGYWVHVPADTVWTVLKVEDYTAPSPPINPRLNLIDNTIKLTWEPSPSEDVSHYIIYKSNDPYQFNFTSSLATTTSLSYTYTPSNSSENIYYIIRAVDYAGNEENNTLTIGKFVLTLDVGYNLISTPLLPWDNSLDAIFGANLTGGLIQAQSDKVYKWDAVNEEWLVAYLYEDGNPINTGWIFVTNTFTIEPDVGYRVWIRDDLGHPPATINLTGVVPENRSVQISVGTNLVGYTSFESIILQNGQFDTSSGLYSSGFTGGTSLATSDLIIMWDGSSNVTQYIYEDGGMFDGTWTGTTFSLEPGEGYWIEVRETHEEFTWNYGG